MTIFINGKQKRVKRPQTIDGMDIDEFIRQNADPIWLLQNGMFEELDEYENDHENYIEYGHTHKERIMTIKEQIRITASKMMNVNSTEIRDDMNLEKILFPLTQELDALFRVPIELNHGEYESATVEGIAKYYENIADKIEI